jgi:hypothetical protein
MTGDRELSRSRQPAPLRVPGPGCLPGSLVAVEVGVRRGTSRPRRRDKARDGHQLSPPPSRATGMGTFFTGDHPHPRWPAGQVQQAGELGDPRAWPYLAAAVIARFPDPARQGAACSFSECAVTIVASISTGISAPSAPGARSPASAQARSRAAARALRITRSACGLPARPGHGPGIDSGLCSSVPGLGIITRRAGIGRVSPCSQRPLELAQQPGSTSWSCLASAHLQLRLELP